jgi:hypothetical protein
VSSVDNAYIPHPKLIVRCRGCGDHIFFARTINDRVIPIDAQPTRNGNLSVAAAGAHQAPIATVITSGQRAGMQAAGMPVYSSHFQACPKSEEYRRRHQNRKGKR